MTGTQRQTYARQVISWLTDLGYTHCFFVAGGNIMHLLEAVRTELVAIPVVNEVAAGIAAEYFNEVADPARHRAFAMVTAGPGLTNIVTAIAGAWMESRDLLVVGGQVKSEDLSRGAVRQRGIQEIDGVALVESICSVSMRIESPAPRDVISKAVLAGRSARNGPVFLEFCLDVQAAAPVGDMRPDSRSSAVQAGPAAVAQHEIDSVRELLRHAQRPVILIGGGVSRATASELRDELAESPVPVMTTWNGADRMDSRAPSYWGRPNTWGMRYSNILLQQADLVLALGTRLGLQQTGFNWQQFVPVGRVVQVDLDRAELGKGHPRVDLAICADANAVLSAVMRLSSQLPLAARLAAWREFGAQVKQLLPLDEAANGHPAGFVNPYTFVGLLGAQLRDDDIVVPSSSGGAYTVTMQALAQRADQFVISDKGMASMGYGLSGAIGAATAHPQRRVVHLEGDGGLAQNLQEFGTVAAQDLNVKTFIFCNQGYASIRMTQLNYFGGGYVGCDQATGLGLPRWGSIFEAYGIPWLSLDPADPLGPGVARLLETPGPAGFLVPVDPAQTYFPKISSRVLPDGRMESNPLHLMSPELEPQLAAEVLRFLPAGALS